MVVQLSQHHVLINVVREVNEEKLNMVFLVWLYFGAEGVLIFIIQVILVGTSLVAQ